jgi:hypothetical protein
MSAKSEAADAAAKAVAKGALNLIRWGKKIIPATADDIERFGPNAARVKALLRFIPTISNDAAKITSAAKNTLAVENRLWNKSISEAIDAAENATRYEAFKQARYHADDAKRYSNLSAMPSTAQMSAGDAANAEAVSDLITPQAYRVLTLPMATGRRFDMTVPNAPEGFTNIARSLGERSLLATPKDVELARRVSMLSPDMQQVYFNLLGEGTDPAQLLQALRLMGQ